MSETKFCPHCNGEVIASAHKCKHCGNWIDKQCPICGEWILSGAKKCKHCGTWLDKSAQEQFVQTAPAPEPVTVTQYVEKDDEGDDTASCLMNIELLVVAGCAFFYTNWVGVIVCILILEALLQVRFLRILYCIIVSALWGMVGYTFGDTSGFIIVCFLSLAGHAAAMKKGFEH